MGVLNKLLFHTSVTEVDAKRYGIYEIRCIPNSRVYIGQSKRPFIVRWLEHQGSLLKNAHNKYFQNSFNKYGIKAFEIRIIEFLPERLEKLNDLRLQSLKEETKLISDEDITEISKWLDEKEVYYIKKHKKEFGEKSVFNSNDGGNGLNPTEDVRQSLSVAGKRPYEISELSKEISTYLGISYNEFGSYRHHIETYLYDNWISVTYEDICKYAGFSERISKQRKGKKHSESHTETLRQSTIKRYEKHEEHEKLSKAMKESRSKGIGKENMSNGQKKRFEDPEQRRKISESEKGKVVSEETKETLSIKGKELWQDEHYRNMMRKSRISDEQRAVDDILWMVYQIKPKLRFRSLEWKLAFIDKLAQEL